MLSKISLFETVISWGEGVLPYKRLMGMCRWMGSHFHDCINYSGIVFLIVTCQEWGRTFSDFWG